MTHPLLFRLKVVHEAVVQLDFERTFPPLEATPASAALAAHAKRIYSELGKDLTVRERPTGGGTDAANASLKTKAPVVEGFGLRGFGFAPVEVVYDERGNLPLAVDPKSAWALAHPEHFPVVVCIFVF